MLNKKGVRSISFLCRNKKCTDDNREKNGYEGAKVALPIFIDEYTKECDRKVVIENKVNSLVTIEIAILTIFMPIIPFSSIKKYLLQMSNVTCILATIACFLLCISVITCHDCPVL